MLRLVIAALVLAVLQGFAFAQAGKMMSQPAPTAPQGPLFDEKKYKSASESMPDAQKSTDPWAGAREPTAPPAAANTPTTSSKSRNR
jgi:hypothetical protein